MPEMKISSPDVIRRRRAIKNVYASLRLEGQIPSKAEVIIADQFVQGHIDTKEMHSRLISLHPITARS